MKKKRRKQFILDGNVKCIHCGEQAHYLSDTGIPRCEAIHQRCLELKRRFNERKNEYIREFGNPSSNPEIHEKQMVYWTEENRKKQSERFMGVKCPAKGFKNIGRMPWCYGLTKETDFRIAIVAEKKKGRTKENDLGIAAMAEKLTGRTKETHKYIAINAAKKRGISLINAGSFVKGQIPHNRGKPSPLRNIKRSRETRRKQRVSMLRWLSENVFDGERVLPCYNVFACKVFSEIDEFLGSKFGIQSQGQYAGNGGEYQIDKLGYFLDYINWDLKIIIEWDEENHFFNGKLKEKDIQRQKEIQKIFPDFLFIRIRQKGFDADYNQIFKVLKEKENGV